jgi:hypothetical protein
MLPVLFSGAHMLISVSDKQVEVFVSLCFSFLFSLASLLFYILLSSLFLLLHFLFASLSFFLDVVLSLSLLLFQQL